MEASSTISLWLLFLILKLIAFLFFFFQWNCKSHGKIFAENVHGHGLVAHPLCIWPAYYYCCSQNTLYTEHIFSIQLHLKLRERKWRKMKSRKKEGKNCLIFCSPLWLCIEFEVRESVRHGWLLSHLHSLVDLNVIYGMFSCYFVNCVAASFFFTFELYPLIKCNLLVLNNVHISEAALWDCCGSLENSYCSFFASVCNCIHPSRDSEIIQWSPRVLFSKYVKRTKNKTKIVKCLVKTMNAGFQIFVSMQLIISAFSQMTNGRMDFTPFCSCHFLKFLLPNSICTMHLHFSSPTGKPLLLWGSGL